MGGEISTGQIEGVASQINDTLDAALVRGEIREINPLLPMTREYRRGDGFFPELGATVHVDEEGKATGFLTVSYGDETVTTNFRLLYDKDGDSTDSDGCATHLSDGDALEPAERFARRLHDNLLG